MSLREVLMFDFGGTLDADGDRWAVRFHRDYVACGGRLSLEEFEPHFRASDRVLEADPAVRHMGFRAMIEAQAEALRALLPDGPSIDFACVAHRFHADALRTIERNRPMLDALAGRARLALVSNFTGNLDRCLDELRLSRLFSVVADSAIVGWAKPDPRIFEGTLRQLGAAPSAAWMIGDNFEADIRPAAALGINACWLAPLSRPVPAPPVACGRIPRLIDLPELLRTCTA